MASGVKLYMLYFSLWQKNTSGSQMDLLQLCKMEKSNIIY